MVMIISKECFDGKIKFNSFTARELDGGLFDLRNAFELKEIGSGIFL